MAIWMEMRCDINRSGKCYSAQNNGPMQLAGSSRDSQNRAIAELNKRARAEGWQLSRIPLHNGARWSCPACKDLT